MGTLVHRRLLGVAAAMMLLISLIENPVCSAAGESNRFLHSRGLKAKEPKVKSTKVQPKATSKVQKKIPKE